MAGLLDIFGTSGQDTMGLLGMSPEDITKSRNDAQAQALYALAGRLFQGGRGGASIVEGLQQGQQAYRTAMQGSLQSQLQNAQIQELKKKRELEQQALMRQQGVENLITQAYRPETFAETPLTNMMGQQIAGPNQPQAAGLGLEALAPKLMTTLEGRKALSDLVSADKAMRPEGYTLGEGQVRYEGNKPIAFGSPKENLTTDYKNFQQAVNDGYKGNFFQYQKELRKSGAGGDIINYPAGAVPLGKEGQNAVDKAALSTGERLARLNRIETSYDPKFLETKFRGTQEFRAMGEKLGLSKLTPEQKQQLGNYTQFSQDAIRELNAYIVEVTGAAMGTGEEADRIKKGMPNVGSGLLDGDSPTQFASKLANTMKDLRTMEARLQYIKNNGLKIVDVPLERMPEIMRQRERALITSLGLDVNNPQDKAVLKSRLASEFGLMR
jgi:hypothetical protein